VTLERAMQYLSLPREVGRDPESGEPIIANLGRFGPYVRLEAAGVTTYANLESPEDVFTIGVNHAVTLIAEKKAKGGKSFRRQAQALKELGNDPSGAPVKVMSGKYGAYVTDGTVNATLPRGNDQQNVTLQQALDLIAARIEQGGGGKKPKRKPAAKAVKEPKAAKASPKEEAKPAKAAKPKNGKAAAAADDKPAKKPPSKKKVLAETD
jgi:DNA topoisomerase-1